MLRNFDNEVEETRKCLSAAMQATLPSKQFSATIMLALVQLSLIKERIRTTTNLQRRKEFICEFDECRNALQKGIWLLGNSKGSPRTGCGPRRLNVRGSFRRGSLQT